MEYMKIGHTDINASAITFGAMPIGGGTWWSGSDDKVSIDTIHRAYDLGINTIDTAHLRPGPQRGSGGQGHRRPAGQVCDLHQGHL